MGDKNRSATWEGRLGESKIGQRERTYKRKGGKRKKGGVIPRCNRDVRCVKIDRKPQNWQSLLAKAEGKRHQSHNTETEQEGVRAQIS